MLRTPLPTNLGFLYRSLNPRRKKAEYGPRKKGAKDMGYSQLVTHPSTNPARPGLTSVILFLLLLSCQMYTSAMEETKQRSWTFPNGTLMDGCVFARGLNVKLETACFMPTTFTDYDQFDHGEISS